VEQRAQNVRRRVGSGQRALYGIDQVKGIEVAYESQDRDDADGWQDEWQLNLPELCPTGDAIALGGLDHLARDAEERSVDQHHRDTDILPVGDQRHGDERRPGLAEPWSEER